MQYNKRIQFTSDRPVTVKRQTLSDGSQTVALTGYPICYGAISSDRGGYKVRLCNGSANFTDNVLALWHHDFSKPLAGTANGTLEIGEPDEIGIPVTINLDMNTSAGRDACAYVSSGLVSGMSFSMARGFEDYTESKLEDGTPCVDVAKFTCDEVTITPIPAFTDTSIELKPKTDTVNARNPGGMSAITEAKLKLAMATLNKIGI